MNVRLVVSGIICVVVFLAGTLFFATHESTPLISKKQAATATSAPEVQVKDTYSSKKKTHTLSGTIVVPTPCTSVEAAATVDPQALSVIQLNLTTQTNDGICLMRETSHSFTVSVEATSSATIVTSVNGVLVPAQ